MLLLMMSHLWDAQLKKLHDLFCYKFGSHTWKVNIARYC